MGKIWIVKGCWWALKTEILALYMALDHSDLALFVTLLKAARDKCLGVFWKMYYQQKQIMLLFIALEGEILQLGQVTTPFSQQVCRQQWI